MKNELFMTEPLVVNNVVRKFGENTALDGASFALRRGEFIGLLGPNGAGKTTLIRMISGRLKADSGTITVHGLEQRSGGNAEIMPRLGIIPQNIAIYDNLTARENLSLFGTIFGVPKTDLAARIDEAMDWPGRSIMRTRIAILRRHATAVEYRLWCSASAGCDSFG